MAKKILLVEVDGDRRASTAEMLKRVGYEVVEAEGADELAASVGDQVSGMVLLDYATLQRDVDNVEAILREHPGTREAPVVVMDMGVLAAASGVVSVVERVIGPPMETPRRHSPPPWVH